MRPIRAIANDIIGDMQHQCRAMKKPVPPRQRFYSAWPYLLAMLELRTCEDSFIADSGSSVVAYGLSNLTTYRGPTAKALKAELKAHLEAAR